MASLVLAFHVTTELTVATRYLDLAGVLGCAVLGGVIARQEGLDLFGFLVVGLLSGLGGGLMRDVLLQHGTPVALTDYAYLATCFAGILMSFLMNMGQAVWTRAFTVLDAAVIGFWSVAGVNKTLQAGLGWLPAVLLGTMSAVGGGALRDIVLGRRPAVFGGNGLYATVALVVSGVTVICWYSGTPQIGTALGIPLALALRLLAVHYHWSLPGGRDWHPAARLAEVPARLRPEGPPRRGGPSSRDDEEA
ncbi:trimeric intracellular cation channel family protein [Streptomyces sp. NPDC057682]|uniref:trimeric intracellular cation channel family protein n=1 Tax=unclassified Streptomyces TaxID=2593676 RepID=UPI00364D1E73